jgi:CheY-like chemotaxis protein
LLGFLPFNPLLRVSAEGADVQSALQAGIDHFIEKPVKVRPIFCLV